MIWFRFRGPPLRAFLFCRVLVDLGPPSTEFLFRRVLVHLRPFSGLASLASLGRKVLVVSLDQRDQTRPSTAFLGRRDMELWTDRRTSLCNLGA